MAPSLAGPGGGSRSAGAGKGVQTAGCPAGSLPFVVPGAREVTGTVGTRSQLTLGMPVPAQVKQQAGGARSYSTRFTTNPHMQRMKELRVFVQSPGMIGDPYKPPPPPLPFVKSWLSREGWRRRRTRVLEYIRTAYTVASLRRRNRGFSQRAFYRDAVALYGKVNQALAAGDRTQLRQLVTETVFTAMKREMRARDEAGWERVAWELVGPLKHLSTAQARLLALSKEDTSNAFVQITLIFRSTQKWAAYNRKGKLVAGDPGKELLVEDIWVLERHLLHPEHSWRVCARLGTK